MQPAARPDLAPITTGVDGSPSCDDAVRWAAQEAQSAGRPVHLLHIMLSGSDRGPGSPDQRSAAALARASELVLKVAPGVAVTTEAVAGRPSQVLIERSEASSMIVTGRHGEGFRGLEMTSVLGSVSSQLVTYARGPVVVVPDFEPPKELDGAEPSPVVVGVDPGPQTQAAIGFAVEHAFRHGRPLIALRAWNLLTDAPAIRSMYPTSGDLESSQRQVLSEALAGWHDRYPDVPIHQRLVRRRASHALIDAAAQAALVVVAARGEGGFPRLLLGGVAEKVVRHAPCPVAVIR
jgi:nucleotide-binding universal stress UspA family protein